MRTSSKILFMLLGTLIIIQLSFVSATGQASDSLKLGLIINPSNQNDLDSLAEQFIQAFHQYSNLSVVHIDTNLSISAEPFAIDSVALTFLKQKEFRSLILGEVSVTDSIQLLNIKLITIDTISVIKIGELDLSQQDFDNRLASVVQEVVNFVQAMNKPDGDFRIIIAPINIKESDSTLIWYRQTLIDTLKAIFSSPQFANIQFEFIDDDLTDSLNQILDWEENLATKFGITYKADMIISGVINYDEGQNPIYHPYMNIKSNSELDNDQFVGIKSLSGKTCLLKDFFLPPITFNNLRPLINFLSAYFLIQIGKYSEAISKLKISSSLPGYFYLAESYLNRGFTRQKDLTSVRADWDSSLLYLNKCLLNTESLVDSICINNNLGVTYQMLGMIDSATVYYTKAYNALQSVLAHDDFICISNNVGNICLLSGQWKQALDVFHSIISVMEQSQDSLNLAVTYENLGNIYQIIMQRHKAITYYNNALKIRKLLNDENGMANSLSFLGNVHHETQELDKAKEYFGQALRISQKLHNEPQIAECYDRLGQVFQDLGVLDSALVYYQKSFETFELLDDCDGSLRAMLHQASAYQKQKDFKQAIQLYEKAFRFANGVNSISIRAQIFDRLGDIYNHQHNLITAYDYYKQSADLYEQIENFEILSLILYNMGLIRLKQNDYAEGYQLLKKAVSIDEQHGFNNLSGEKDFLDQLKGILRKN
ncbi:MAG: tetratricopeptide repeat protein [bacterium]|nr:MAG: tetratricopeptide repeat protein [bacterium]